VFFSLAETVDWADDVSVGSAALIGFSANSEDVTEGFGSAALGARSVSASLVSTFNTGVNTLSVLVVEGCIAALGLASSDSVVVALNEVVLAAEFSGFNTLLLGVTEDVWVTALVAREIVLTAVLETGIAGGDVASVS
jgi:hypothetical protein